jgi:RNA polymerase sigma-70 factor (ECF subfamily)
VASPENPPSSARELAADPARLEGWLERERPRMRRMVALRIDARLQARLDASDVVQEACVEAVQRLPEFLRSEEMPFAVWLRLITAQKLTQIHRRHLDAQMRDAGREQALDASGGLGLEASSAALASAIAVASTTSPSLAAVRVEQLGRLREALEALKPEDREILVLRHFEQWGNEEAAQILGLGAPAAGMRYARALRRLRDLLDDPPSQ